MLRALDKWLIPFLRRRVPADDGLTHVMIAVCDHFEPLHDTDKAGALKRLGTWTESFPKIVGAFRDADGQPPKHTFFYPVEQYDPDLVGPLADLCRLTGSEVEIHLHHDRDTAKGVEAALEQGKSDLLEHGLLSRDNSGAVRYGFIHGNWALNNSHSSGRGCGVDREIPILRGTGCYADFTMPSVPSPTQARVVNQIAWLRDLQGRRALDLAEPAVVDPALKRRDNRRELLMIQGPLALNWSRRKWGLIPKIENGDLTGANPLTASRMRLSVEQRISVAGKSDWVFVKFHTHGGIEPNFRMLLGEPMRRFHETLADEKAVRVHYVTAREMTNLVHAAEDGCPGDPGNYRDYCFRLTP